MPFTTSPSSKMGSPFFITEEVLHSASLNSSPLLSAFKELSSLTIHCSHLPITEKINRVLANLQNNMIIIIFLICSLSTFVPCKIRKIYGCAELFPLWTGYYKRRRNYF